jgi:hypothetical protein
MSGGMSELDAMIARLRTLAGPTVGARVAAKAAPLVDVEIKRTVRAGTDPLGNTWKPKKDGGRPLEHAADHITTSAQGPIVVSVLVGVDVYHHLGSGHVPRRQILPDGASVPERVTAAVEKAAAEVLREIVEGR